MRRIRSDIARENLTVVPNSVFGFAWLLYLLAGAILFFWVAELLPSLRMYNQSARFLLVMLPPAVSAAHAILAWGLFALKRWARTGTYYLVIAHLTGAIIAMEITSHRYPGGWGDFAASLLYLTFGGPLLAYAIYAIWVLIKLSKPAVASLFRL